MPFSYIRKMLPDFFLFENVLTLNIIKYSNLFMYSTHNNVSSSENVLLTN